MGKQTGSGLLVRSEMILRPLGPLHPLGGCVDRCRDGGLHVLIFRRARLILLIIGGSNKEALLRA